MARVQKTTESCVEMTLSSHQPDETTKDEAALAAVRNRIIADASLEQFLKEWADGVMQLPALEREFERQNHIAVMKPLYGEAERLVDAALAGAQGGRSARLVAREPVDAAELLDELVFLLVDYVAFPTLAPVEAVALWVLHTYIYQQFETSPYLAITSAERRSGKTRLLDVLELLVAKPWRVISPTEAVLYRKVERDAPTILFDETDTVFGPKAGSNYEGIRALLNAGRRRGTKVPRCVGEGSKMALHEFEVYFPKALAGIGELPDTVADRSIPIRMRRRRPGERVERFRMRDVREATKELRAKLAQWGEDAQLDRSTPFIPPELNDRAADSWEPLLAIGESAGERWAANAREAALALSGDEVAEEDSLGVRLLADCRAVFDSCGDDSLATDALIARLVEREEAPGATSSASRSPRVSSPICCAPTTCGRATGEAAAVRHAATRAVPSRTPGPVICVLKRHNRHRYRVAGISTICKAAQAQMLCRFRNSRFAGMCRLCRFKWAQRGPERVRSPTSALWERRSSSMLERPPDGHPLVGLNARGAPCPRALVSRPATRSHPRWRRPVAGPTARVCPSARRSAIGSGSPPCLSLRCACPVSRQSWRQPSACL